MAAENLYLFYNRMYNIPVVIFRISNPYGPRGQMKHSKYSLINWFIRQAFNGETITIFGDGEQIRDYIYVDDLTDAFIAAAVEPKTNGEVFNVGSGVGTTFKDMVSAIVTIVGSGKVTHIPWPRNYINVETGDYVADISKLKRYISWEPAISLREGVERTIKYYKKYKKYYY